MSVLDNVETVRISKHAKEHLGSRFLMPLKQVKKIVKEQKGMIYYDEKHDNYVFQVGRTAVCAAIDGTEAVVTTVFRTKTGKYRNKARYRRMN